MFSSLSFPICLIVLFSFFPIYLMEKYKENQLKISLIIVLIFSILSLPIILWTIIVTQVNLPLYGLDELNLKYLFTSFFGFLNLYKSTNVIVGSVLFIIFILSIVKLFRNNTNNIWTVNLTILFFYFVLPFLLSKPYQPVIVGTFLAIFFIPVFNFFKFI